MSIAKATRERRLKEKRERKAEKKAAVHAARAEASTKGDDNG